MQMLNLIMVLLENSWMLKISSGDTTGERREYMRKIYRGWMKSEFDYCLFETSADDLKIGDTLTDAFGRIWIVTVIF